jgi:hypothetical protein
VEEMWRRRDSADAEQKAELQTAAGLPSEDEMKMLYPSSEDEIQVHEVINHMKGSSKQVMKKTKKVGTSGIEHDGGLKEYQGVEEAGDTQRWHKEKKNLWEGFRQDI